MPLCRTYHVDIIVSIVCVIGCGDVYMHICDITADTGRHDFRAKPRRDTGRSVPRKRGATTNTREEMVHGAAGDHNARRNFTVRFNLY